MIDVTDDVIRRWIIDDDRKFLEVIRNPLIGDLKKNDSKIRFKVIGWRKEHGDSVIELDRDQILEMIQEGKEKGLHMSDPGSDTPYLKRDWKTELLQR